MSPSESQDARPLRPAAVAGLFYPADASRCRAELSEYLNAASVAASRNEVLLAASKVYGGLTPHAGWAYCGPTAAHTLSTAATRPDVDTFVIFGAAHRLIGRSAVVYDAGKWHTPLGDMTIDGEFARAAINASPHLIEDIAAHESEHSIEVEVPFLQAIAPQARLLPIMVPVTPDAPAIGRMVAQQARALNRNVMFFASSDLTHYGPRYGFTPEGETTEGLKWAMEVNDRRLLDHILALDAEAIVPETRAHQNACGPGAIAATIAACREVGATRALLLQHTNSSQAMGPRGANILDAVGYASVVFI